VLLCDCKQQKLCSTTTTEHVTHVSYHNNVKKLKEMQEMSCHIQNLFPFHDRVTISSNVVNLILTNKSSNGSEYIKSGSCLDYIGHTVH
jgi:hypothetical protein